MEDRTWTHYRHGLGLLPPDLDNMWSEDGEWHNEPDKVQWVNAITDLDCLAVRGTLGSWCGYVGVPPGHPYHGLPVQALPELVVDGGISYAESCDEEADEGCGICHIPEPGRPADVWWIGFACGGLPPLMITLADHPLPYGLGSYRPLTYVRGQVELLAFQLDRARSQLVEIPVGV